MSKQTADHPDQSEIRELLNKICPSLEELKVFVLDYFSEVHQSLQGPDYSQLEYMNKFLLCLSTNLGQVWSAVERHRPNNAAVITAREQLEKRRLLHKIDRYRASTKHRINELETVKRILRNDYGLQVDERIDDDLNQLNAALSSPWVPEQRLDNRFILHSLIGSGGVAEIWSAYDETNKRTVALRFLLSTKRSEQWLCGRFVRGLEALRELTQKESIPGLVGVLEIVPETSSTTNVAYGVMEFVQGGNLEQLISDSKISRKERQMKALKMISGLGSTLDHLHRHNFVHCDIKPSNILFSEGSSSPRLTDFDAAMIINQSQDEARARAEAEAQRSLTVRIATKSFCAPELERNEPSNSLTPRIDTYSLAMTAVAVFSGNPWPARITINRDFGEIDSLAPNLRSLPISIKKVLGRALSIDPFKRHDSASEFCRELQNSITKEKIFDKNGFGSDSDYNIKVSSSQAVLNLAKPAALAACTAVVTAAILRLILSGQPIDKPKIGSPHGNPDMTVDFAIHAAVPYDMRTDLSKNLPIEEPKISNPIAGNKDNYRQESACPANMWPIRTASAEGGADGPFWLDKYEVTLSQYMQCVRSGSCSPLSGEVILPANIEKLEPRIQGIFNGLCNVGSGISQKGEHPVNCVNINQALEYCRWEKKRLPTASEWDFAARGNNLRQKYPWGNNPPAPGWVNACGDECVTYIQRQGLMDTKILNNWFSWAYKDKGKDKWPTTAPVNDNEMGDVSIYHIIGMGGNVSEWVLPDDRTCIDSLNKFTKCNKAPIKGGNWSAYGEDLLLDDKIRSERLKAPTTQSYAIGFRCAKDWTLSK
jgi:formylglycine-generating enzyme required for sulfatase activity